MRVNTNKTEVMISGECQKVIRKAIIWPGGFCGRGVGSSSIQCTRCQKWVHSKFCSLAVLNPRVGHTMDVLSPFIPVLCHSD